MIELHNIIRLPHAVACPIIFILFYGKVWLRGVLKIIMNGHFLVLLSVWVLFLNLY